MNSVDSMQRAHLIAPLGQKGSGNARYAAAMFFHQRGELGSEALELYRTLAKDDVADPLALLTKAGRKTDLAFVNRVISEQVNVIAHLIQQIDRYLSAFDLGGAQDVRNGIARWSSSAFTSLEPTGLPACSHLETALRAMKDRGLADAIAAASPHLEWISYDSYPRAEIGEAFADGHAYCSLIGGEGFFHAGDFDLGLFIIAPNTLYSDHHHAAPELYAPLTGPHGWRFLPEETFKWLDADVPVWNEPWAPHATQTGAVPFLCIFGWTKDVNIPAKIIPPGSRP